jgi:RND family efflux transporter MFP subunit
MTLRFPPHRLGLLIVLMSGSLAGCSQSSGPQTGAEPPAVSVAYPLERKVADYEHFTGRTAAPDSVQVRARVSGYLQKINYKEGADVEEGDILYEIDPRPYEAALKQAQAQVTLQQAQLKYNEAVYQRNVRLMKDGQAVDLETVQQSRAQRDTTQASLEAARAAVEQAELNLGWTKVRSAITGRIGRALITVGNLVIADQTLLTTIVSQDPMYAYFDVDEGTMLRVQQLIREGKFKVAPDGARVPVTLALATEQGFPHEGYVNFVNNEVDPATGTLQVRGVFPNPKPPVGVRVLWPGLFVRVRVSIGPPYDALLVNQRAIGTDQSLKFIYVVDDQNEVVRRDVQLGSEHGALQVVREGLSPRERVVVDAVLRVHPGMVIKPKLVEMPDSGSADRPPMRAANTTAPKTRSPPPAPSMQQNPAPTQTRH